MVHFYTIKQFPDSNFCLNVCNFGGSIDELLSTLDFLFLFIGS